MCPRGRVSVKLAIAHDWLDRPMGGAERCLVEMARLWPEAPVYTLLVDERRYGALIDPARIRTSWLQSLPAALRRRQKYLLPLIPTAVEQWDFAGFDVVLSSSSAFTKNVLTPPDTLHVSYCYSPMRFVWDYWPRYLEDQRIGPVRTGAARALASWLRVWDLAGAARVDSWLAISHTVARRIRKYYGLEARVVYPPVEVGAFTPVDPRHRSDEWLCLSTLTPYKRVDLAIEAFNRSGRRLVVAGDGPDRARLQALAGPTIRFTGHVSDAERIRLLAECRAFVFPGEEDFGIAPVEAMASGTPVVAYGVGGLRETVVEGVTGTFFEQPDAAALNCAVDRLESMRDGLVLESLVERARLFSAERFRAELTEAVESAHDARLSRRRAGA